MLGDFSCGFRTNRVSILYRQLINSMCSCFYFMAMGEADMFAGFRYDSLALKDIALDERNPRIVSQIALSSQNEILSYLYDNEELESFVKKIASEGKNVGAERPYVVKKGTGYIVVEGNTRIAAYKLLAGLIKPPSDYAGTVPHVADVAKNNLLRVDCSIAPTRDALMPIMASAHFGTGDKSKWGYLGSRKAVYDEWKSGKSLPKLAKLFSVTQGEIKELILEYQLYLKALNLPWTKKEEEVLLKPNLAFNPPVRFLQTSGHKDKMGVSFDSANLKVVLVKDADKKFKHLLNKLVINPVKGLGATATYDAVFADYGTVAVTSKGGKSKSGSGAKGSRSGGTSGSGASPSTSGTTGGAGSAKPGALFGYHAKMNNGLLKQLMKEAKDIRSNRFPAAATFLLRNIVEAILKHIIDDQKANKLGTTLDLEGCLNLCATNLVSLTATDKKILSEFKKDHLAFLNLGAHGNLIPNETRVLQARDTIDQFIKKHV
jgi:hypothetical protein